MCRSILFLLKNNIILFKKINLIFIYSLNISLQKKIHYTILSRCTKCDFNMKHFFYETNNLGNYLINSHITKLIIYNKIIFQL